MTLLVTADDVATWLSIPLPLDIPVQSRIERQIRTSQNKVQTYLGRPLVATDRTLTGLWADERYPLEDPKAWPQARDTIEDRLRVVSYTAEPSTGTFAVTFKVGLDVANDPELEPIIDYVLVDAAASLRRDPLFTQVARVVSSVSAGGQSVSYEKAEAAAGQAGGALTIDSLKRWKRLAIYQRPSAPITPWPYARGYR